MSVGVESKLCGVAVIVTEHAAQSLATLDGAVASNDFIARIDELVVQALMVAFAVVVVQEGDRCPAQRLLAE